MQTDDNGYNISDYLREIAPDFPIVDAVEQFAAQKRKSGLFNSVFYVSDNNFNIPFKRFIFKYELNNGKTSIQFDNEDNIVHREYEDNGEKYSIVIKDNKTDGDIIVSNVSYICGVGF